MCPDRDQRWRGCSVNIIADDWRVSPSPPTKNIEDIIAEQSLYPRIEDFIIIRDRLMQLT